MIPGTNSLKEIEIVAGASKDYRMELDGKHVTGTCDDLEAVKQAAFCILNTERYRYPIYSWNYGIELADLHGKPEDYVQSELPVRVTEALMQDDRIESVDGFEFKTTRVATSQLQAKKEIIVSFMVHTIFGDFAAEKRWM